MKQTVQVFSLVGPKPGTEKEKRRYRLKWRIDGRDFSRSFKVKAQGERFRSELLVAVADGTRFDPATGRPLPWVKSDATWWTWSREWLGLKWPRWAGKTRSSGVESLVALTPHLVRPGAPDPPAELRSWLRNVGFPPQTDPVDLEGPELAWLERWSVPLEELEPSILEATLNASTLKRDGTVMVASVVRRRRNSLKTVLTAAVRRGLIVSNPMDRVEWEMPQHSLEVDVSTVASIGDVDDVVELVADLPRGGGRYAAFFAAIGLAGLRPSEAAALEIADLDLPETGWGTARLRGAITSPGTRYTADGGTTEAKGLKHRAQGSTREVPLPPDLVDRLRTHLKRWPSESGKVFENGEAHPVTAENYGPVWGRARRELWPEGHPLAKATVYGLRHTAATTMLRAGVMPSEVARRLGHSVDVLMRVYAGVFHDERDRSNALIDAELAEQREANGEGPPK